MRKLSLFLLLSLLLADRVHAQEEPPPILDLAAKLASDDLKVRRQAAWALWQQRASAGPAAVALAWAVRDEDKYVRETSARAVQYLLIDAPGAVPELVRGLTDERVEVRRLASEMLAWCYDHVASARGELVAVLKGDDDGQVRANAANALRLLPPESADPAVPALVAATGDAEPRVRMEAIAALGWLRREETFAVADALLGDGDARVRERTLRAIHTIGTRPERFAERAAELMGDQDLGVRRRAAFLLGLYPGMVEIAVPVLLSALREDEHPVRIAAAVALGSFGHADPRVPPALGEALSGLDYWLCNSAIASLVKAGPCAAGQLPALARVIRESADLRLRVAAAEAIDAILGPGIEEAIAALEAETGRDPDSSTLRAAAVLLRIRVRDPDSLASLVDALGDDLLGDYAAQLLGDLDRAAQPAIARLIEISGGEGAEALRAHYALIRLDPLQAEASLGYLRDVLGDPDDPRRGTAARLIGLLGPAGAPASPDLVKLLSMDDTMLATIAATSLGQIGPAARDALPVLRKLADGSPRALTAMAEYAIRRITEEPDQASSHGGD